MELSRRSFLRYSVAAGSATALSGLIGSGVNIVRESKEGPVRDAGLLGTAQKIEHYEIASYGILAEFARTMGHDEVVSILEEILE